MAKPTSIAKPIRKSDIPVTRLETGWLVCPVAVNGASEHVLIRRIRARWPHAYEAYVAEQRAILGQAILTRAMANLQIIYIYCIGKKEKPLVGALYIATYDIVRRNVSVYDSLDIAYFSDDWDAALEGLSFTYPLLVHPLEESVTAEPITTAGT